MQLFLQDLASARLNETVQELTSKLAASVDAVLSISDADLAEAIEAYSSIGRDGRLGTMAAEEDEDLFACRAALMRLHHLQLLTKGPSDIPQLYLSLHKLLQASKGHQGISIAHTAASPSTGTFSLVRLNCCFKLLICTVQQVCTQLW